jgi:hypothetical protein
VALHTDGLGIPTEKTLAYPIARGGDIDPGTTISSQEREFFQTNPSSITSQEVEIGSLASLNKERNRGTIKLKNNVNVPYRYIGSDPIPSIASECVRRGFERSGDLPVGVQSHGLQVAGAQRLHQLRRCRSFQCFCPSVAPKFVWRRPVLSTAPNAKPNCEQTSGEGCSTSVP